MKNTPATRIDTLCAKAMKLVAADAYFPGRMHFATTIATRLEAEITATLATKRADRPTSRNGLGTACERCWRMYFLAGDDAAVDRVKVVCAKLMGLTWIPGYGYSHQ